MITLENETETRLSLFLCYHNPKGLIWKTFKDKNEDNDVSKDRKL